MVKLRTSGLAGVLLTGALLTASAALGQPSGYLTAPGQYSFPVPPGDYMASHYNGDGTAPTPTAMPYDINAGCFPTPVNYMLPHYAAPDPSAAPYFTANCPGAFPVAAGSYMAPWYMPGGGAAASSASASGPAPAPARSFLVFFDWDRATLTNRARQIVKEAADNSTHVAYTRIEVNGYTDTSGTPQYNMGLSIRRADAVKGELIRDGVPAASIGTQGFGETHLLVPTGVGVREPQNRRVEIIIR